MCRFYFFQGLSKAKIMYHLNGDLKSNGNRCDGPFSMVFDDAQYSFLRQRRGVPPGYGADELELTLSELSLPLATMDRQLLFQCDLFVGFI